MKHRLIIAVVILLLLGGVVMLVRSLADRVKGPVGRLHVVLVREMEPVPELDEWAPAAPGKFAKETLAAQTEFQKIAADIEDLVRAPTVRALSRWAREEMETFLSVPQLRDTELACVAVAPGAERLLFEGVWAELPSHSPLVTRRLLVLLQVRRGEAARLTINLRE